MIYCMLYNKKCDVHQTFADEYPTSCASCNSGTGKSHKEFYKRITKEEYEGPMTPTGFPACPNCGNPTVTKGQYCCVDCAIEASSKKEESQMNIDKLKAAVEKLDEAIKTNKDILPAIEKVHFEFEEVKEYYGLPY